MGNTRKGLPPYLSYGTFRSFLESLAVAGVPNRIDRSLMPSKSGTTQALLLSAVRYLGLASENGVSAPELQRLVMAEGTERRNLWRKILAKAYPTLVGSEFNLEGATTNEVAEVFRNEGVSSPDTRRKCVTFFSRAAKDAGIKLSPHIKPYAGTRPSTRRGRTSNTHSPLEEPARPTDSQTGNGSRDLELFLTKVPPWNPEWSQEAIDKWLASVARLKKIADESKRTNGFNPSE